MEKQETIMQLFEMYKDKVYETADTNNKILGKIIQVEKPFYNSLTKEQKNQYEKIEDLGNTRHEEIDKNIFTFAYSLANRLLIESLKDK